jgi:hypothetical protein
MHFKVSGTWRSDYAVDPFVVGMHYTATPSNMAIVAVFTNCVMQVYDLSNPALLTGNPVDWPKTYVKINGSMAMSGSGSQGFDYDETVTSIVPGYVASMVFSGSRTSSENTTVTSTNLQTVNEATSAAAETANLPTVISYNSTVEVSSTEKLNNLGYTSGPPTELGKYTTYKNWTGNISSTTYWKASGTVGSEPFNMYLNMSNSQTGKQYCEEAKAANPGSNVTYDCN